jgi:Zn-finger nucleic acid-binding protein
MQCPVDSADLLMAERHGVEIDYCPKCRGIWLDRGELDKIIEQADGRSGDRERNDDDREREDDYEEERGRGRGRRRRRMSDFFEGFGGD